MGSRRAETTIDLMARECIANQLRMLNRVVTGVFDNEFRPLKLTASQMVILALTAKRGRLRAAELGRALQMDASTLSRNIERIRIRGWLEESPTEDQRSRPFRLTASGEKILRDAIRAWERAQANAVRLLGREGVALLKTVTKDVRARMSASERDHSRLKEKEQWDT
jgi:DNA-binding MarR family transcriptional regulator